MNQLLSDGAPRKRKKGFEGPIPDNRITIYFYVIKKPYME